MSERDLDRDYAQVDTSPTEHEQEVAEVAEGEQPANRGGLLGGIADAEDEPTRDPAGKSSADDLEADRRGDDESV
jgi:hypothetical protein